MKGMQLNITVKDKYLFIERGPLKCKVLLEKLGPEFKKRKKLDMEQVQLGLATGAYAAAFVRIELWDRSLFAEAIANGTMPMLFLLGAMRQEPVWVCGIGKPYFIADNGYPDEVEAALRCIDARCTQDLNYQFILMQDEDQDYIKVDVDRIIKSEKNGKYTRVLTACGEGVMI